MASGCTKTQTTISLYGHQKPSNKQSLLVCPRITLRSLLTDVIMKRWKRSAVMVTIDQIRREVERIAPDYNIREVKLFGSYATGCATSNSDVDLMVEYCENPVSLFKIFGFKEEVAQALGVEVDILKYPLKNVIYPDFVLGEMVDIYAN
jgi:predicted nucleotidyltransferase